MKFCSLFSVVFIVSSGLCAFGQAKDPNAAEILLRYKKSLLWSQSVSMRIDATIDVDANDPRKKFFPSKVDLIFRRGHDRAEWIGQRSIFDDTGNADKLDSKVIKRISTGKLFLDVPNTSPFAAFPRAAVVWRDYKELLEVTLDSKDFGGGPLLGRIHGINHKGIAGLLGESNDLRLHDKQEILDGVSCYVLEGTTKYGKVTAWIAPEKGYNALKWVFECGRDNLFDDAPLSAKWPELQSAKEVFECVEMEEVNDVNTVFVPKRARSTHTVKFANGTKLCSQSEYTVSDIRLNPDFESLGAFKIDLPDGTRVFVEECPGVRYIWQGGEIVPADDPTFEEIDKTIDELKKQADN